MIKSVAQSLTRRLSAQPQLQILDPVVEFVAVDVMHGLVAR